MSDQACGTPDECEGSGRSPYQLTTYPQNYIRLSRPNPVQLASPELQYSACFLAMGFPGPPELPLTNWPRVFRPFAPLDDGSDIRLNCRPVPAHAQTKHRLPRMVREFVRLSTNRSSAGVESLTVTLKTRSDAHLRLAAVA